MEPTKTVSNEELAKLLKQWANEPHVARKETKEEHEIIDKMIRADRIKHKGHVL